MKLELFEEIKNIGICETGKRYLECKEKDLNFLLKMWQRWPEYLNEHSEQVTPLLRKYLSENDKQLLADQDIFFDTEFEKSIKSSQIMISGYSKGLIEVKEWGVPKIYLFDNSELKVKCKQNSILFVECYNNSKIEVDTIHKARAIVHRYDHSDVKFNGAEVIKKEIKRGQVFNKKEQGTL